MYLMQPRETEPESDNQNHHKLTTCTERKVSHIKIAEPKSHLFVIFLHCLHINGGIS